MLTLAVVAAALRWARTAGAREGRILRALLGALCLLTLVVLASALHRLGLYEQAFGFTRTRLAANAFLLFDAALFVLVVVALASARRDWLPRATVLLTRAVARSRSGSAIPTAGSRRTTSSATRPPAGSTSATSPA